jgi:CxC6 like cysteine cluster associated with KDZ transposases
MVIDGVNMGCPCCGYHDCDNPLESVRDQFCTEHRQYNNECVVTSCSAPVERGIKTCLDQDHRKLELHYYERGKAMFQLKARLDRLRISQPHDWLSLGSIRHDQG